MSTGPQVRSSLRVAVISGLYRAASSPNVRLPHAEIKEVVVFLSEAIAVPGHGLAVCVSVSVERQSRACRMIATGLKAFHSALFWRLPRYVTAPPFTDWRFLGHISNETPSAVFRIRWSINEAVPSAVQLGLTIEPLG